MQTRRSYLTLEHFVPLDVGARESERVVGRPIGFWEDSWNRLKENRGALISLVLIVLLFVMAFLVGPLLSRYSPFAQDLTSAYTGPSKEFWFGSDDFGRDMWTRVWAGTRVSLYIALLAALLDLFVGARSGRSPDIWAAGWKASCSASSRSSTASPTWWSPFWRWLSSSQASSP